MLQLQSGGGAAAEAVESCWARAVGCVPPYRHSTDPRLPYPPTLPQVGVKTLTGRSIARDPLQSAEGWNKFTAGFAVGGLSGAAWGYVCTQVLPYYS